MWLALISALLQLTRLVVSYTQQRQLIEAGKAQQLAESLNASIGILERMDKARDDAVAKFDDPGSVPDDDPYRRD